MADLAHRAPGDTDLFGDRDARNWAQRFCDIRRQVLAERGLDLAESEDCMLTWFAGAIETGYGLGRDDEAAAEPTTGGEPWPRSLSGG